MCCCRWCEQWPRWGLLLSRDPLLRYPFIITHLKANSSPLCCYCPNYNSSMNISVGLKSTTRKCNISQYKSEGRSFITVKIKDLTVFKEGIWSNEFTVSLHRKLQHLQQTRFMNAYEQTPMFCTWGGFSHFSHTFLFKEKCHKSKGWKRQSCQLLVPLISCEKSSAIISTVGRRLRLPQAWLCYGLRPETQTFTICWRPSRVSVVLRGAFLLKELQLSSTETCFSSSEEQWAH